MHQRSAPGKNHYRYTGCALWKAMKAPRRTAVSIKIQICRSKWSQARCFGPFPSNSPPTHVYVIDMIWYDRIWYDWHWLTIYIYIYNAYTLTPQCVSIRFIVQAQWCVCVCFIPVNLRISWDLMIVWKPIAAPWQNINDNELTTKSWSKQLENKTPATHSVDQSLIC